MKHALSLILFVISLFAATSCFAQQQRAKKPMTITVAPTPLVILTSSLPAGKVGELYQSIISADKGTPPYTWSLDAGSTLPPGLTLAQYVNTDGPTPIPTDQGVIAGRPTASGSFSFTVVVTDSGTPPLTARLKVTMQTPRGL